jgi:hypothetical protein
MTNLREIGTAFGEADEQNDLMPPQAFWPMYDAGQFD